MCKFFEVSRSGYYAFLKQIDKPDRDLSLTNKIRECQQEIYCNPKTVLRVMQKYNLLEYAKRKKKRIISVAQ